MNTAHLSRQKRAPFPYGRISAGCLDSQAVTGKRNIPFAAALKKNGLEAELLDMDEPEKLAHAFAAMLPETAAAQRANAAMADFLKAHI